MGKRGSHLLILCTSQKFSWSLMVSAAWCGMEQLICSWKPLSYHLRQFLQFMEPDLPGLVPGFMALKVLLSDLIRAWTAEPQGFLFLSASGLITGGPGHGLKHITSYVNYCSSFLTVPPASGFALLQSSSQMANHVIITPLVLSHRTNSKLFIHIYQALGDLAPTCLSDLFYCVFPCCCMLRHTCLFFCT